MIQAKYKGSTEIYILQIIPKLIQISGENRAVLDIVCFGKDGKIFIDRANCFKVNKCDSLTLATYKHYTEDVSIVSVVSLRSEEKKTEPFLFCIFISEDREIRIDKTEYFRIKTEAPKEKSRIIKPT